MTTGSQVPEQETRDAFENLRIIRSLMERAHVYRAISAPAALAGGVLALLMAGPPFFLRANVKSVIISPMMFVALWLSVLVFVSALNIYLLSREVRRRDQSLISPGMKMAIRALAPGLFAGGMAGLVAAFFLNSLTLTAVFWVLGYGLALLATSSFSPPSLIRLGRAFVVTGVVLFAIAGWKWQDSVLPNDTLWASAIMGLTFGLLHVIYAIIILLTAKRTGAA